MNYFSLDFIIWSYIHEIETNILVQFFNKDFKLIKLLLKEAKKDKMCIREKLNKDFKLNKLLLKDAKKDKMCIREKL